MSRSVEQALLSLLPTQNSDLPPPLVDLASSLLAQSRNRASTLKADEEVARLYACAHIACDRLKISLNLPPIDPRPPIPPRTYKRLYGHLDRILPSTSATGRGTPRSRARSTTANSPAPARALPSRKTPTKEKSLAQFRGPPAGGKKGTPSKLNQKLFAAAAAAAAASDARKDGESLLPPWIRPTAAHLCTRLSGGSGRDLIPAVMYGLQTIIAPDHRRTRDGWTNGHLAALVGTVYWFVSDSARRPPGDGETGFPTARYKAARKEILAALKDARAAVVAATTATVTASKKRKSITGDEEEEQGDATEAWWEGWETIGWRDLDETVDEVRKREWLKSDWYRSIEYLRERGTDDEEGEDDEAGGEGTNMAGFQTRQADTMLQDRFDFLSERRRAESKGWRDGMLRRIEQLERENADAMEIDSQQQR